MIQLTSLEHDLKPYGFVKLDYGRTWTNGNISFIGGAMHITGRATEQDILAIAIMYKNDFIGEEAGREERE